MTNGISSASCRWKREAAAVWLWPGAWVGAELVLHPVWLPAVLPDWHGGSPGGRTARAPPPLELQVGLVPDAGYALTAEAAALSNAVLSSSCNSPTTSDLWTQRIINGALWTGLGMSSF